MRPLFSNENLSFAAYRYVVVLRNYFFCKFTETGKDDARKGDQMERLQKGEEVDVDPNDPEVQKAATKIQASFRGHKAREDVKKHKDEDAAAVKIQASFRGHKAREQVKDIKVSQSKEQVPESVDAAEEPQHAEETPDAEPATSGDAEVAEEPEKTEIASEDQPAEVQPDDPAAAEAEAVTQESETEKGEIVEEDGLPDDAILGGGAEAADAVDKGETEDVQAEEAPGEMTEASEKDEGKDEPGKETDEGAGGEVGGEEEQIDLDMSDPDLQSAVVKIQASFRGHKAREEVKSLKSSESLTEQVPSEEKPGEDKQEEIEDSEKQEGIGNSEKQGETEGEEKQGEIEGEEKQEGNEGGEKPELSEGDGDKGDDDTKPSVTEDADDSKPSQD